MDDEGVDFDQRTNTIAIMIVINSYDGSWQRAVSNKPKIRVRNNVLIHESADARQYDDFCRELRRQNLVISDWVKYFPRKKMNQYRLSKIKID